MWRVRSRCLISSRRLEAVEPGICTSSRITRSPRGAARGAPPRRSSRLTSSLAERLEDRLEREEVLRAVVDEQDRRPAVTRSRVGPRAGRRRRRARRGTGRSREREDRVGGRRASAALGHLAALRGRRVLDDRDAAASLDPREPGGAVGVRPGEDDADDALAVRVGRRLEEHVDRRAREVDALVRREREVARARRAGGSRAARGRRARLDRRPCPRPRRRAASVRRRSRPREPALDASARRCCATTTGRVESAGRPPSSSRTACSPPQEAPITIELVRSRDLPVELLDARRAPRSCRRVGRSRIDSLWPRRARRSARGSRRRARARGPAASGRSRSSRCGRRSRGTR